MLSLALIDYKLQKGLSFEAFFEKFKTILSEIKKISVDVLLFPELFCFELMDDPEDDVCVKNQIREKCLRSGFQEFINYTQNFCDTSKTCVVLGTIPEKIGLKLLNRSWVIRPHSPKIYCDKKLITPEEKIYEFEQGDIGFLNFEWESCRISLGICYDTENPFFSTGIAPHNPHLILIPKMTSVHGQKRVVRCAMARAVEHHAFVAVAGVKSDNYYHSETIVFTPCDEDYSGELKPTFDNSCIKIFKLPVDKIEQTKKTTGFNPVRDELQHQKKAQVILYADSDSSH